MVSQIRKGNFRIIVYSFHPLSQQIEAYRFSSTFYSIHTVQSVFLPADPGPRSSRRHPNRNGSVIDPVTGLRRGALSHSLPVT